MATTAIERIEKAIERIEGFKAKLEPINGEVPKRLTPYTADRGARGSSTISDWKRLRFNPKSYPGLKVTVLLADGTPAKDKDTVEKVRKTYALAAV